MKPIPERLFGFRLMSAAITPTTAKVGGLAPPPPIEPNGTTQVNQEPPIEPATKIPQ